ncbi:MAG: ANTAR domain-containing protein, partial [Chloroflexota bacterium]
EIHNTAETAETLKKQLTGREIIDKAKHLLISQGMTEDEAYHALQADARKRQISLVDMAQRVLGKY